MAAALVAHIRGGGIAHGLDLATAPKAAFLEAFESLVLEPRGLDHRVQFTGPTGTNAVEAAIKLARRATGRRNIIAFTHGFHGVSQGALAATASRHHRMAPTLSLPDVTRMPFDGYLGDGTDTAELLDRLLADPSSGIDPPAAVLLETVQGEGGLNVASARWLRRVAAITERHGALLVIDDVQAGCGRTGGFFSFDGCGVVPDLVALSKSVSGFGLPMALLLIRPQWDVWRPGEHNGTFRGNAHAFVTARVALEKFWHDGRFSGEVTDRAQLVGERLERIAKLVPGARVKGRGMMQGIDLGGSEVAADVWRLSAARRLVIETSGPNDEVIKVLAPLTTPEDQLLRGLDILEEAAATTGHAVAV
jgi:diaminobutyrate-2-oxoglutarate transaminase